jgi:hypothetical protein
MTTYALRQIAWGALYGSFTNILNRDITHYQILQD